MLGRSGFMVLVGMRRAPLHARNATTAQTILGHACAEVDVVRPSDVPADDDREFFVTAWCLHPRFIPDEQVVFIPEPRILSPVEATLTVLPGLRYLVRLRLVAFQDWNAPPASPADDGHGGGDADEDDGPSDGNFHHGVHDGCGGPPRGPTPEDDYSGGRDSDDDGSADNNFNRYHPRIDHRCCGRSSPSCPTALARTSVLVGMVCCLLVPGRHGLMREGIAIGGPLEILDVASPRP